MKQDKPQVVRTHDVQLDADYVQWLGEIKARYRSAQAKAAVRVNAEQLLFNWLLGRDLVQKKADERWGSGVVEQVSLDLQAAFPESKGFSAPNLWFMKKWYLFYTSLAGQEKLYQLGRELQGADKLVDTKLYQLGREINTATPQQPVGDFQKGVPFPMYFALVPWRHHVEIVTKSKTIDEALFYIKRTIAGNWSRATLMNCIKSDLYHTSGGAVTNFADRLSSPQRELAQAITKDTYDFGFLTLEEGYQEEALESELEKQLTRFLIRTGNGFFLSREAETDYYSGQDAKTRHAFLPYPTELLCGGRVEGRSFSA